MEIFRILLVKIEPEEYFSSHEVRFIQGQILPALRMNGIYLLIAIVSDFWIAGVAANFLSFRWSFRRTPDRFWASIGLSLFALLISYLGMTRVRLSFSRTVNDSHWGIDSKWFFVALLLLSVLSLAFAIWNRTRTLKHVADGN